MQTMNVTIIQNYMFLLSNMQYNGAFQGLKLSSATFEDPFSSTFRGESDVARIDSAQSMRELFPLAHIPVRGFFSGYVKRRESYWQPAAKAPATLQLSWLIDSLAEELSAFADEGLVLRRLEVLEADSVDIWIEQHGQTDGIFVVRVQLEGRTDPLDFPGMYIRELFQGRHRQIGVRMPSGGTLIDVRSML